MPAQEQGGSLPPLWITSTLPIGGHGLGLWITFALPSEGL
ncbi:hypothetical protein FRAAL6829 [Frankia alni ACN14a]|uniref:Uncharacterized protein n=1 Tax=Frankia alni (strain DSM 45986 / CECT 9034 / ACN14a) TaxID=326424 RepID=Q0RAT8_FRAAA|nr:hypothetical protein FRAAL6829 [Frankia alni ACN14a]